MFSKACEYGIRATVYIAVQSLKERRVNLKEIAKAIESPEAFTAKILQQLVKSNLIDSTKGPSGGFEINKIQFKQIKLSQIVSAIDGDSIYTGCGLGLKECDENKPCPVHDKFKNIRDELRQMLETTSIEELSLGLKEGLTFLKR
ncbi:MAG: transcriptional regulator [Bacteroidetes bacterium HGW-Bacteroidetes-13]|nr:MAG: transcriptional regulator [Bacteroidetes bacterium HGW-Bacteroidetes-13]